MNRPTHTDGTDLWGRVTSQEAMQAAWGRVAANEGSAGGDGIGIGAFRRNLFANITELRAEILCGSYRTGPFRKVSIPKRRPGYRILTIPSIRDRVVHTSIARALTPIFEATFEDGSFGYRPNRGVVQAVQRIETWRKRGYDVVIEADIVRYFDNIDHEILRQKVEHVITTLPGAPPLLALMDRVLADQAQALGTPGQGLAQGSPLSPLLANVYLDALDEEIEDQGVKIVRFADDFVILCKSEKKAEKVLAHCVQVLAEHNLRLHQDGTRIVSFEKGFDFVGYLFLRTLALKQDRPQDAPKRGKPVKSTVTDEGLIELDDEGSRFDPGKRVLYVLDADHRLCIRNRSFSVRREDDTELIAIPHRRIGRIEVGPYVDYDRRAIELAIDAGIELAILDPWGQTRGLVYSSRSKLAALQFAQAKAILDDAFRAEIARGIAESRVRNQRTQLMRLNRSRGDAEVRAALDAMQRTLRKSPGMTTVNEFLGMEGSASALYWPALGRMFGTREGPQFKRTRPGRDPFNTSINYLTGILQRDTRAAIQGVGLHPGFAFLHGSRDRQDGLVFDLMEPFRAALTEGIAVFLFNSRRLTDDMFSAGANGEIRIGEDGRRALVTGYESAVSRRVNKPDEPGKLAWRPMMLHQARGLANAVQKLDADRFTPYLMEA